jgi:hypothetical protein
MYRGGGKMIFVAMMVYAVHKYSLRRPVDSILEAVLTVSPNIQYLGILIPTTPATHGPANI